MLKTYFLLRKLQNSRILRINDGIPIFRALFVYERKHKGDFQILYI